MSGLSTYHVVYRKAGRRWWQCDNDDRAPHVYIGQGYCPCGHTIRRPKVKARS